MNKYVNREESWLEFNKRVLYLSMMDGIPLLERLNFLGITASNLDEFIMVRFAGLCDRYRNCVEGEDISGLSCDEEYELIYEKLFKFKSMQYKCWEKINTVTLKDAGINICKVSELEDADRDSVLDIFTKQIFPLLTPISYDVTKDFPVIKTSQLNIVVYIKDRHSDVLCIIPLDIALPRMYKIGNVETYVLLEDIVLEFASKVFRNKNIQFKGVMRILREADIELGHDDDIYIVDRMRNVLTQRRSSRVIMMEISKNFPKDIEKILRKEFGIGKDNIFKVNGPLDLSFLKERYIRDESKEYDKFTPQYPIELIGEQDVFTAIDNGDFILHHPYESFAIVIKLLEHAAVDPSVLAIKQTLYRVSSEESPIIDALCNAATNGKKVSVLVEIKARFDEQQNLNLLNKMRDSGCQLIYGSDELKTHCKFILIAKQGKKLIKLYSHISTGNYNEKTSNIYTDISLFTSSNKIGFDLLNVFNNLSGCSEINKLEKLIVSPSSIRTKLYTMIDQEISNVEAGLNGRIIFKINSISDKGIIDKLYEASEKGVKVDIICRGICSMKKINSNIMIKSIIGRFLEHSRIYYFSNNEDFRVFISSADLLTRNLDRRVEFMVPITYTPTKNRLYEMLEIFIKDVVNSYRLTEDNDWKIIAHEPELFNCHTHFMNSAINGVKLKNVPKISLNYKK